MTQMPDPSRVMALATQYWDSQTLLTANRIGLFGAIGAEALDVDQIAAALGTRPRPTRLLLNACVALGLLESDRGLYRNNAVSLTYLVPGGSAYMGNTIRYSDNLYSTWGRLEETLRTDQPALREESYLGEDQATTRAFVYGMHERALGIARILVGLVDLTGCGVMLDVGGGPGTYSGLMVQRYAGLRSTVLDLPGVVAIAAEIVADMGVAERVSLMPGDYRVSDFPENNDVVLISGVLHRESESGSRALIARAAATLAPGGRLVISDVFTEAGGAKPPFAALFGLNMMLTAPDGGVHADSDIADWMRDAGLEIVQMQPFPAPLPHRLVVGRR